VAPIEASTDSRVDPRLAASARQRRFENESSAATPTKIRSSHSARPDARREEGGGERVAARSFSTAGVGSDIG
jgi:hypothetical protein